MRVAHILRKYNPAEWGGTETALRHLIAGLSTHEVESVVHAPRTEIPVAAPDPLAEAGVTLRRFGTTVPVWGLSESERRQMVMIGGNLLSFSLVANLWRERDLDVIHTHALGRLGGTGLAIARRRRLPLVVTIHGGVYDLPEKMAREFHATKRPGFEWGKIFGLLVRSRRLLDEADAVFTCNPREAERLRERHPRQRVEVQPHGVDAVRYWVDQRAAARAAYPWLQGARVLLVLGRVDPVKNQLWAVERMPELLHEFPNAQLVLVGACTDQSYGEQLQRRVRELGLENHVRIIGGLPTADSRLIGLMQCAELMLLPSLSETFGLVILEAWAAGTPILTSRTSGAQALIEPGRNGALFDLADPASFDVAVRTALRDQEWRRRVAAEGGRQVAAQYDTAVIGAQVKRLYEELIEQRHALRHPAR
jgi:alpha-maltose-1-phosphate synthase